MSVVYYKTVVPYLAPSNGAMRREQSMETFSYYSFSTEHYTIAWPYPAHGALPRCVCTNRARLVSSPPC